VNSGGLQAVLQAAVGNGLSFDPFSLVASHGWWKFEGGVIS
jgi:hypothetical protein